MFYRMKSSITVVLVFLALIGLVTIGCSKKQVKVTPTELEKFTLEESLEELEIAEIETEFPPEEEIEIKALKKIPNLGDIYFEFDKFDLTQRARETLSTNAKWLKKNSEVKIIIEGHCDERGTIEYNLALGQKRAVMVREYMIALGVKPERIITISYGEEKPVDLGNNEEAWARNRRANTLAIVEN